MVSFLQSLVLWCLYYYLQQEYPMTDYVKRTELAREGKFVLTEDEIVFDAADVMRIGKDIFIQISQVIIKQLNK